MWSWPLTYDLENNTILWRSISPISKPYFVKKSSNGEFLCLNAHNFTLESKDVQVHSFGYNSRKPQWTRYGTNVHIFILGSCNILSFIYISLSMWEELWWQRAYWIVSKIGLVTLTYDLEKSIGFQILLRTKYVPRMLILECSQGCYGRIDGRTVALLYPFGTSLARE